MTGQNTRPTPSSDVAAIVERFDAAAQDWGYTSDQGYKASEIEASRNSYESAKAALLDAISRLSPPAQVEVTDERSLSAEGMLLDEDLWAEAEVALTTTDAKPVVPAEPVAFQFWLEVQQCWTNMPTDWKPEEDTEGKYTIRPLYAASPSPVEGDVERLSFDDLQTLIQVRDRRHSIIESSTDRLLQAFALSDRGLLALEQLPSGADLHITRKGRKAIDAFLASEGKTDA